MIKRENVHQHGCHSLVLWRLPWIMHRSGMSACLLSNSFVLLTILLLFIVIATHSFTIPEKIFLTSPSFISRQTFTKNARNPCPSGSAALLMSRDVDVRTSDEDIINAASAVTQASCRILGVKSIGVDYGLVRTGVAVTVGYNPKPLAILSELNTTQVCERIVQMAKSEQADQIIVGLPLHKNGTEAEQTNITRVFAKELVQLAMKKLGPKIEVHLWDERYTSKEAAARAHNRDPDRQLYGQLDAEAACIILEHYYNDNGEGAERVNVPQEISQRHILEWEASQADVERQLQAAREERDAKLRWRKEAMEQDRKIEMENCRNLETASSRKSKRKKRRQK